MLDKIQHIVVLMLENRSFDHMLGFLYRDTNNVSHAGQPFDGLTGNESNLDADGNAVKVFDIDVTQDYGYYMPGADPGEGYSAANAELFGTTKPARGAVPDNGGFIHDFAYTLEWEAKANQKDPRSYPIFPGTTPSSIMGIFPPAALPILSGLARGYAVSDRWFASVPTETMPNRAFACAATSQGHMDDKTKSFTVPSIFGRLSAARVPWAIYGYDADPLTRLDFPDTASAPDEHFGHFGDFQKAVAEDRLAAYTFLEPSWEASGNSQHPNYDVALGEQLIHDVYYTLRNGPRWNETLLVIVYDEHGGCYDHVPPPANAVAPDDTVGEYSFDFTRFGVRVPAVLVSPRIAAGTVLRPPSDTPFDHTSILKTIERRWNLQPLTKRDAAAPDLGAALTLATPRTDDPIAGVAVPVSKVHPFSDATPATHLQQVHAELVARLPIPRRAGMAPCAPLGPSSAEHARFILERITLWKKTRNG